MPLQELGQRVERSEQFAPHRQPGNCPLNRADRGCRLALLGKPRTEPYERFRQVREGAAVGGDEIPRCPQVTAKEQDVEPILNSADARKKLRVLRDEAGLRQCLLGAGKVVGLFVAACGFGLVAGLFPDRARLTPLAELGVELGRLARIEMLPRELGGLPHQAGAAVAIERLPVAT